MSAEGLNVEDSGRMLNNSEGLQSGWPDGCETSRRVLECVRLTAAFVRTAERRVICGPARWVAFFGIIRATTFQSGAEATAVQTLARRSCPLNRGLHLTELLAVGGLQRIPAASIQIGNEQSAFVNPAPAHFFLEKAASKAAAFGVKSSLRTKAQDSVAP